MIRGHILQKLRHHLKTLIVSFYDTSDKECCILYGFRLRFAKLADSDNQVF